MGNVALAALDPIETGEPETSNLEAAIEEWSRSTGARTIAFVAVSSEMALRLATIGFDSIQVGREAWLEVPGYRPRGDSAKGVRAARNQAQRLGVTVEPISGSQVTADPALRRELSEIERAWRRTSAIQVDGFLMSTDIFRHASLRRYYIARANGRLEGFLVASPIGGSKSAFLEDVFYRPDHVRGVSEVLVLEAIRSLEAEGLKSVSLGMVTMTEVGPGPGTRPGLLLRRILPLSARVLRAVYNADGISLFRKRFGPNWTGVFIAARRTGRQRLGVLGWILVIAAAIRAHRPRLALAPAVWTRTLVVRARRYPLTCALAIATLGSFLLVNRGGPLPVSLEKAWEFRASAPLREWPIRSLVSDFLFQSWQHLAALLSLTLLLVPGVERRYPRRFLLPFSALVLLLGDILDVIFVLIPFTYVRPDLQARVLESGDVGSSLLLMAFLGLRLHAERRARDWLFALCILGLVFALVLVHPHIDRFVLSLDHLLLLGVGYATGQVRLGISKASGS